jgi:hypothetical protein
MTPVNPRQLQGAIADKYSVNRMSGEQHKCLFVVIWLSTAMLYGRTARHVVTAEKCFVITGLVAMELKP